MKDVFICEIVGCVTDERMTQALTAQALWRATTNKRLALRLIHHLDTRQESQLFEVAFGGRSKSELVHHHRYVMRADAQSAIQEYIESFYDRRRRHLRLGYVAFILSPLA